MERYQREKKFFDRVFRDILKERKSLTIPEDQINRYRHPSPLPVYIRAFSFYLLGDVAGKKVLDYGCGDGYNAVFLAKKGAEVVAVDISDQSVSLTKARAEINNVADKIKTIQMNAEETSFADEEFDCIIGNNILHHLNLNRAANEIHRILKKRGTAIFREPVIFSRALGIIRKMIPYRHSDITEDERPLSNAALGLFSEKFSKIEWWPFEAVSRIQFVFKNRLILKFLFKLDYFLFKTFPFMKRFASCAVLRCIR